VTFFSKSHFSWELHRSGNCELFEEFHHFSLYCGGLFSPKLTFPGNYIAQKIANFLKKFVSLSIYFSFHFTSISQLLPGRQRIILHSRVDLKPPGSNVVIPAHVRSHLYIMLSFKLLHATPRGNYIPDWRPCAPSLISSREVHSSGCDSVAGVQIRCPRTH
jgi:hypothetical protein